MSNYSVNLKVFVGDDVVNKCDSSLRVEDQGVARPTKREQSKLIARLDLLS
jgi:hypothetical protein